MVDIRNFTNKPAVAATFRERGGLQLVTYWVDVTAKGKMLSSDPMPVDAAAWPQDVIAKLSDLSVAHRSARAVSDKLWSARPPEVTLADIDAYLKNRPQNVGNSTHARLQEGFIAEMRFQKTFGPAQAESKRLSDELKSISSMMASPSFMKGIAGQAIVLRVGSNDSDERSYCLYRRSVWSCSRALEAGQWQLLIDRLIKSEEAQLAVALAEDSGTSPGRERGGSDTERNIELLCEVCNRAKSDSIM